METLGLSDSTQRSESRLKSLLWPSIQTGTDVDYLGTQRYWVSTLVSVVSLCSADLLLLLVVGLMFLSAAR